MTQSQIARPFAGIILSPEIEGWKPLVSIELEALQAAVGGYVTAVEIPHGTLWCVDEAPVGTGANMYAYLFPTVVTTVGMLFGTIVLTGGADDEGNTKPLGERWARSIARRVAMHADVANNPELIMWVNQYRRSRRR
jgi:hypothetical protein